MNHKAKIFFFIVIGVVILVVATSFFSGITEKKGTHKVILKFENYVGNKVLKLDSVEYRNGIPQFYTISMLKYYIGRIHLTKYFTGNDDGSISLAPGYTSSEYYLIDEDDPASKTITLNDVPDGDYSTINFLIGVDSIHNCSGAQAGALDPMNGMFWAWNTGYIFFKLEGHSPVSKANGNMLEFHVGGYKYPNNCGRRISLKFVANDIKKMPDDCSIITIKADISKVFHSTNTIDFSQLSSVTDFHNAATIANNYKNMFSILQ